MRCGRCSLHLAAAHGGGVNYRDRGRCAEGVVVLLQVDAQLVPCMCRDYVLLHHRGKKGSWVGLGWVGLGWVELGWLGF
jgi:hypothetical protein